MKITVTVLLSSLLLCGCSERHPTSADLAKLLVPTGRFIKFRDGDVLYVEKLNGSALQNIIIYRTTSDGGKATLKTTIHSDSGTVSPSLGEGSLRLTLQDARSVTGLNTTTNKELVVVLHD